MATYKKSYDIFISYAREDNKNGWITAFVEELQKQHSKFAPGRQLDVFFDRTDIPQRSDWQLTLTERIAHSSLFLAFLSPAYLASEWCKREWMAWLDHEVAVHILTEGIQKILVVPVEHLHNSDVKEKDLIKQIDKYCKNRSDHVSLEMLGVPVIKSLRSRQTSNDFCERYKEHGPEAIKHETVQKILQELADQAVEHTEKIKQGDSSAGNVPDYNKNFTGRVDDLVKLRKWLCQDDRTGVIYGIHGLGGIGKTELSFAYAHAFANAYPGGRYLVKCEGDHTLQNAILTDDEFPAWFNDDIREDDRKDPTNYYNKLRRKIAERLREKGDILIILDNVTDLDILERKQTSMLTSIGPNLHILATTRKMPGQGTEDNWLQLERLTKLESLSLLEKFKAFDDEKEEEAAIHIVNYLDGFTLALEVVGASLKKRGTYRAIAASLDITKLDAIGEDKKVEIMRHDDEKRLSAVLSPTLDDPDFPLAAKRALQFAALLPPDMVAIPWLRDLVGAEFPEELEHGVSTEKWDLTVEELEERALLTFGSKEKTFARVHRLVQELVLSKMSEEEQVSLVEALDSFVTSRVEALNEETNWGNARWEVDACEALAWKWVEDRDVRASWLLNDTGQWLKNAYYDWARAEAAMRRAWVIDEKSYGKDHPKVATDLNNLALLLKATNRHSEAEPLMQRVIDIFEKSYGKDHPNVATSLSNLAQLLQATNRLADAEDRIMRALEIDEKSYGEDHPNVATGLNNLAGLLQATNRHSEAEPLMQRVIDIFEKSYGKDHPKVAISLNNLAWLLRTMNRLDEAEPLMRRALEIDENSYGKDHPNVARDLNNLAQVLQDTNRLADAEPLMRRALEIVENSYGKDHPDVAIDLNNLAGLLQATNRHSEAEPLMRRAWEIDEKSYGKDHPNVARDLNNLAQLLQATNRLAEAEPLLRRALEIGEKSYGKDHPSVATNINNLASLYYSTNRLAEAEPLMRRALDIDENSYGKDHPDVARDLSNLAQLLKATNRLDEAEPLMRRALEIDENSYGKDHPKVALRLNNLALLLKATNRHSEAEPLIRRALEILIGFLRATGYAHPNLNAAANNYCEILDSLGASIDQITAILALLAPELFEQPPSREAAIAFAQQQLAKARESGNETIARILEEIIDQQLNPEER